MAEKVIDGRITSPFGMRRDPINGAVRVHQGIDIAAPVGTPIYSPCYGVVVAVFDHPSGGKTLILKSSTEGIRFGFCHLSSIEVSVGSAVARGRMVARSGNTGRSTGPHLHFSVKCSGVWIENSYSGGEFVDPTPHIEIKD